MDQQPKYCIGAKTIKLLEENIRVNPHDLRFDNGFLNTTPKAQTTKEKTGLDQKFLNLCFKRYYQESEKTAYRMGENICKYTI